MTATTDAPPIDSSKSQTGAGDELPTGAVSRPVSGASGLSLKSGGKSGQKLGSGMPPSPDPSAKDNPAADMRKMRRIIAEDPDWSLATVPHLVDLCVRHIVDNFECEFVN